MLSILGHISLYHSTVLEYYLQDITNKRSVNIILQDDIHANRIPFFLAEIIE